MTGAPRRGYASRMADKSPPIAALISVAFPGFGHFYAGAWTRGVGVMIGLYFGFTVCAMAGLFFFALFPALYAVAAWDAYRMAKRFNERPPPAAAAPAPPSLEAALDKTMPKVPILWSSSSVGPHKTSSEVIVVSERTGTDSGKWGYVVSLSSPALSGDVYIDCTHTDAKGSVWTSY